MRVTTEKLVNRNAPIKVRTKPTNPSQPARGACHAGIAGSPISSSNDPTKPRSITGSHKALTYWLGSFMPGKRTVLRTLPMIASRAPTSRATPLERYRVPDDIVHDLLAGMYCTYLLCDVQTN